MKVFEYDILILNMLFVRRYCPNGAVYWDNFIPTVLKFLVMHF